MKNKNLRFVLLLSFYILLCNNQLKAQIEVDFSEYNTKSEILITKTDNNFLRAEWLTNDGGQCALTLNLKNDGFLFNTLVASTNHDDQMTIIASKINPQFDVRIGTRAETSTRSSTKYWPYIFFDKVDSRPYTKFKSSLTLKAIK